MEIDKLKGLFEGGNFPNAQINILTGDGIHISYKSSEEKKGEPEPASKDAIMLITGTVPLIIFQQKLW